MTDIRPPPPLVVEVICSRDDMHKLLIFISQNITYRFDTKRLREVDSGVYRYEVILNSVVKNREIAVALVNLAARTIKAESKMEDHDTAIEMMINFIKEHSKAST